MPIEPDEFREVLRDLIAEGALVEHDGRFYARGFEPEEARKGREHEHQYELLWGPMDGARIGLTKDCTHVVFFIGASWVVYIRMGTGPRMFHCGNCATEEEADRLIDDE